MLNKILSLEVLEIFGFFFFKYRKSKGTVCIQKGLIFWSWYKHVFFWIFDLHDKKKNTDFLSNIENTLCTENWALNLWFLLEGVFFALCAPSLVTVSSNLSNFSRGKKVLWCMDYCSYWGFVSVISYAMLLVYTVFKICNMSLLHMFMQSLL